MSTPRLLFITGKGGVGKTTVAAALSARLAEQGHRVLIVELAADRGLAGLFGKECLHTTPTPLAARLSAVRIEPRALVEAYFLRLLRVRFLTDRLLSSVTFNAITTAAPGVTEFLILEHVLQWLDAGRRRRRAFDIVVVDSPATGHALRLLRTPRQLAAMVPRGPIGTTARRLLALLADHERTHVVLVTIADEMAVSETLEAQQVLTGDLDMRLARPVVNRVFPRRFTAAEGRELTSLGTDCGSDPVLAAARLQISSRRDTERHLRRLRRAFGAPPISLREVCRHPVHRTDLDRMGRTLSRALFRKDCGT